MLINKLTKLLEQALKSLHYFHRLQTSLQIHYNFLMLLQIILLHYLKHPLHLDKKASDLDIKYICPLHGPVWRTDIDYFIDKYDKWSSYEPEEKGVLIVYGSMYGNTEKAAENLAMRLVEKGMSNITMYDASKTHVSYLIADAFKYSHIVLASATYNLNIYPPVENFIRDMKALNLQKRTVAVIENGTWAPRSGQLIRELLGEMKEMNVLDNKILIKSSMKEENVDEMEALAYEINILSSKLDRLIFVISRFLVMAKGRFVCHLFSL